MATNASRSPRTFRAPQPHQATSACTASIPLPLWVNERSNHALDSDPCAGPWHRWDGRRRTAEARVAGCQRPGPPTDAHGGESRAHCSGIPPTPSPPPAPLERHGPIPQRRPTASPTTPATTRITPPVDAPSGMHRVVLRARVARPVTDWGRDVVGGGPSHGDGVGCRRRGHELAVPRRRRSAPARSRPPARRTTPGRRGAPGSSRR